MACNPPYCYTTGNDCFGCNCGCCPKCPCVKKISWLVVTGTDPILYNDPCNGMPVECTAGPGLRRKSNGITFPKNNQVQAQAPPPCIVDGETVYYPPTFATITLEFDGCCLVPIGPESNPTIYNSTLWGAQNDGTITITRATVCDTNELAPIIKINGELVYATSIPIKKCDSVFISFAPCCTAPCCLVCSTLRTFWFGDICGGGKTDPCASTALVKVKASKIQKTIEVNKNALMNRIKKSIKFQKT